MTGQLALPAIDAPGPSCHLFTSLAIAALAVFGLPSGAAAQAVYGSISGTVTDNSGGALPGVTVTITSVERKTVDTVVTNESGSTPRSGCCPASTK